MSRPEYGDFNREHQYPCETCKGAGWTEARLMMSMREIAHMAEKFPNAEVAIERQRCTKCQGTGGGAFKSDQATAYAATQAAKPITERRKRKGPRE